MIGNGRSLGKPVMDVQELNFYQEGQTTPYGQTIENITLQQVWDNIKQSSQISQKMVSDTGNPYCMRHISHSKFTLSIDRPMWTLSIRLIGGRSRV